MNTLTTRQAKFVSEYLVDGKGGPAAIRAGYSAKNADTIACRLLDVPQVKSALDKKRVALEVKNDISINYVLDESKNIVEWFKAERAENGKNLMLAAGAASDSLDRIAKILGYATTARLELTGKNGGPIESRHVDLSAYTTDLLEKFADTAEG